MAYHTPPIKRVKEQGEMPLHSLIPIPSNSTIFLIGWDRGWVKVPSLLYTQSSVCNGDVCDTKTVVVTCSTMNEIAKYHTSLLVCG